MIVTEDKIQLIGECEKLSVDFCRDNNDSLMIALTKGGDKLMSLSMDSGCVQSFIMILKNTPTSNMVKLNDGRYEKRGVYRYMYATSKDGRVGVNKHGSHRTIVIQLDKDEIQVGFVVLTEVDIDLLIGSLYIWLGNNFLSSRTICDMFKNNELQSNKLDVINIRLAVDL